MLKNRSLVALDIGSSSVKVVELTGGRRFNLKALGLELLPPGVVVDGQIKDEGAVLEITRTLLEKLNIVPHGRRASLCLGGSQVYIKRVLVQLDANAELDEQVIYEAEQHFQVDLADVYFRYEPLAHEPDSQGYLPVLLVAARREVVDQAVGLVHELGMKAGIIDCQILCLANVMELNYAIGEGTVAVVNIGATTCQILLLRDGQFVFTRDTFIAGDEYSRQITEIMSLNYENAETLKISASMGEQALPQQVQTIIDDLNENLVNEIRSAVEYYVQGDEIMPHRAGVSHIFLSGGGARILGLDTAIAANLQVPVTVVNPFQEVELHPRKFDMNYIVTQGHLYSAGVGLAMRRMGDDR